MVGDVEGGSVAPGRLHALEVCFYGEFAFVTPCQTRVGGKREGELNVTTLIQAAIAKGYRLLDAQKKRLPSFHNLDLLYVLLFYFPFNPIFHPISIPALYLHLLYCDILYR